VFVSEASRARPAARSRRWLRTQAASNVEDVLLVVGLDCDGNQVVFETLLEKHRTGAVKPVSTEQHGDDYVVHTLSDVRLVWGLSRREVFWDGAFSVAIPHGWTVAEDEELVTLEPASRRGAAQFSVLERQEPLEPGVGEASELVCRIANRRGIDLPQPTERRTSAGFAAMVTFDEQGDDRVTRWFAGAQTAPMRVVIYTYNDDGSDDESRDAAAEIFASLVVASS
jgi:hypothetical protein